MSKHPSTLSFQRSTLLYGSSSQSEKKQQTKQSFNLLPSKFQIFVATTMIRPKRILPLLVPFFIQANAQASGSGTTTRYWDCCKSSCGWPGKATLASGSNPVTSCDANDNPITNYNAASGCDSGGSAYMCTTQQPWAVSEDLSYGFAATSIAGGTEATWCCACYKLTFTSGPVAGKQMIVQATNTGGDLGSNQFDLAVCFSLCFKQRLC